MNLECFTSEAIFGQLEPEWNGLLTRSAADRIFSTHEWQTTWWQSFLPGALRLLTCRDETGRLLGIAPLFLDRSIHDDGALSLIGCKEVTDYLDFIAEREHEQAVLGRFADWLAEQQECGRLEFCNIPEDSRALALLPTLLEARGYRVEVLHEDVCPQIHLPADWNTWLGSLDKKQRHELRRKLRRAQGSGLEIERYTPDSGRALDEELEQFLTLMAASDPEKARFLEDDGNRRFFRALAPVMQQRGWLRLNFLRIRHVRAAAYLNFAYRDSILVYNSGLLPEEYGHFSPGIVLLAWNIREALEQGYRVFDFLQGDEDYKYRMGGRDLAVRNLVATRT